MTHRITPAEIEARLSLLPPGERLVGIGPCVAQLQRDVRELRVGLRGLMQAYAACNGTEHEAYAWAENIMRQTE